MNNHDGYVLVSKGKEKPSLSHAARKPFSETMVKRDGSGQFATKSGAKSSVDQSFLDLANSRINDQSLLTSIRDSFQRIMDQNMRMKQIEGERKRTGHPGGYYSRDELEYVKSGKWNQ